MCILCVIFVDNFRIVVHVGGVFVVVVVVDFFIV